MATELQCKGKSGKMYKYTIYDLGTQFSAVPGNYLFVKKLANGSHNILYAGETGDLSERFDDHHKMTCIMRQGATHIHVHKSSGDKKVRRAEEADIREEWDPPCNG